MLQVIATINTKTGHRDKVLSALLAVQAQVLQEHGCHGYQPLVDVAQQLPVQLAYRADTITILESWASLAHLEAHLATAHMQAYFRQVEPWVADVSLQLLQIPVQHL